MLNKKKQLSQAVPTIVLKSRFKAKEMNYREAMKMADEIIRKNKNLMKVLEHL